MGGKIVRTIGLARAKFMIGMMNLADNNTDWCNRSGLRPPKLVVWERPRCVV